ncbi:MAG: transposase family protein [Blastocatellia bacterium]
MIPNKKKKNQELSSEQKSENKLLASERIYVEHAIGGMKRYRILSDRLRVHDIELYDVILGVCAGLWNFYLNH